MSRRDMPCPCGSGLLSWWEKDARGIELCRVCPKCRTDRMVGYRAAVLSDPDEPIEEEE
jgi:hypothetical protein